jgi:N-acetylated-alpha-linked acidic dipeptidase
LNRVFAAVLICALNLSPFTFAQDKAASPAPFNPPASITGFRDAGPELQAEKTFLAVPNADLAREHLRILTSAPHIAGSPEDKKTADYVLQKFKEAGLDAYIQEYKVWMNLPVDIKVDLVAPQGVTMHGPSPEHVSDDPFQSDPRVTPAFNEYSPSGDVTADVVYANYGRLEDFKKLQEMGVDVKGKIVIVRYGMNFRGVKPYIAEQYGAAGVIIYSDPWDDGYFKGDKYPKGPMRPDSAVQRGSVQYLSKYPGDPTTPGIASLPDLPDSQRTPPDKAADLTKVPTTPLSYQDASPILANLAGPESPRDWQGALPFTYHVGPGPAKVHMVLKQNYHWATMYDVIGMVKGSQNPEQWVLSGNHRDAWVYGAVDPNSGTTAMLESVHGIGELVRSGWRPKRTLVFCSWDGEEEGLVGSTEFAEQHENELKNAVAYFNMDVAVAGPNYGASAVPSLKQFERDVVKSVPSPKGGSVYDQWKTGQQKEEKERSQQVNSALGGSPREPNAKVKQDVNVGDLGSGSDFTPFLQHLGVPATDIGSHGPYGVYHSVFDNFAWFTKFGDPTFVYEKEMAQVYGLQAIRMSSADVLPFEYDEYAKEISAYLKTAEQKSKDTFAAQSPSFAAAQEAAQRMQKAGSELLKIQTSGTGDPAQINAALRNAERAFVTEGLPGRTWFKHAIYAPGEYTGYAAVVIPGVNEAIDRKDLAVTQQQLQVLTDAINRAAGVLEKGTGMSSQAAAAGR